MDQFRNPHRLTKDFLDEDDLYKKAGDLVDFLIDWRPSADASLPEMMVELAQVPAQSHLILSLLDELSCILLSLPE